MRDVIYPEDCEDMAKDQGEARIPILVLAGTQDEHVARDHHGAFRADKFRFQDSSDIPFSVIEHQLKHLKDWDTTLRGIDTKHFAPLPDDEVESIVRWLYDTP